MAIHVLQVRSIAGQEARCSLQKSSRRDQEATPIEIGTLRESNLSMSSSSLFGNALSRRSITAAELEQLTVGEVRRDRSSAPVCLFGGIFGGNGKRTSAVPPNKPEFKYHDDVPLPFPTSLLANTFLAGKELLCCYKATRDGFGAMTFHKRSDFKGPCVIIATTSKGGRVGAFNPEGYRSTDDYYDTFDAFLFYWPASTSTEAELQASPGDPIVLPKVGGSGAALFDYARGGPQFGADGLLIGAPLSPVMGGLSGPETDSDQGQGQLSEARSRLGLSYARRPDGMESLFGDDKKATLVEIEVFCSPAIATLYQ